MIIADKIIMLRKKNGWSQEELAEQLNVSRQSVSKWESSLSVPDLNKVVAMSALFGVSTDYLLKDEMEELCGSGTDAHDDEVRRTVTVEEANRYLSIARQTAGRIALGVMLCILSPVLLILLLGLVTAALLPFDQAFASAIGLFVLLSLVACAVALFVSAGLRLSEFECLGQEMLSLSYGVEGIVEKRCQAFFNRYRLCLTLGVVLCICGAIPLVLAGVLSAPPVWLMACVCALLCFCSIGVYMVVRVCCVQGSFERLLQKGDYTEENKRRARHTETVSGIYWCLMTALYLGVSFWTSAWHITWVIWPIAGCLWPLISALFGWREKS